MHNAIFQNSQTHSVTDSILDFGWVFLEIPVKNGIVGMLLTYKSDNQYPGLLWLQLIIDHGILWVWELWSNESSKQKVY